MSDLVTFLRARLDEGEACAQQALANWSWSAGWSAKPHIARHHPALVLADIAAKRMLISRVCEPAASIDGEVGCCHDAESLERGWRLQHFTDDGEYDDEGFPEPIPSGCYGIDILNRTLAPLAEVYPDHPDYDEAWRP